MKSSAFYTLFPLRIIIILFALFTFLHETHAQSIKKMDDATWDAINVAVVTNFTAYQLKGLSVAVVYGGNIAYANAFGTKNVLGDPFTIYTKSLLASVSKTITGVLAMRLVQNGDIGLDDDISDYLPGYNNSGITIRHLLDHQSGIAHYDNCPGGYNGSFNADDSYDVVHGCTICVTPPGSGTLYTTFGNTLLGCIISYVGTDVYGTGYQGLYQQWMRGPGNLNTLQPAHDNSDPDLAEGSEGPGYWNDIGWKLPAGGFISDIVDLANYTRGILNNVFITQTTFDMMKVQQLTSGSPNHTCGDLSNSNYGLSFGLSGGITDDTFRVTHNGANPDHGFTSHISIYPNSNASIVILTNTGDADAAMTAIRSDIEDLVLCPDSRNFTNDISWTEPRIFEGEQITAQSVITSTINDAYIFDADQWVRLLPGFEVTAGKEFQAIVWDGCGGSLHTD